MRGPLREGKWRNRAKSLPGVAGARHAVTAPYRAPRWLAGGHAQTIWPYRLQRPHVALRRERVETPDGDFWDFDWLDADAAAGAPLVVLFHGLEGGSQSHYARALLAALAHARLARRRAAFSRLRRRAESPAARLSLGRSRGDRRDARGDPSRDTAVRHRCYAVGVSLGGSALLNWLGRAGATASRTLTAAAAVSAPLDLMAAGIAIGQGLNRIYTRALPVDAEAEVARDGDAISRPARRGEDPPRAHDVGVRRRRHRAAARLRRNATTTGRVRRRSRGSRDIAVPTLVSTRATIRSFPAQSLPAASDVSGVGHARAAAARRPRRAFRAVRFPATSIGCRPGCYTTSPRRKWRTERSAAGDWPNASTRRHAQRRIATCMLPPEIFKAYDIRGIVGRTLTPQIVQHDRPGARQRSRASASATRSPSAATAACPARELLAALARRHPRVRRRRDRRRHGRHADDVFRRAASRHGVQRDGDRQPQPARLQRPQDGDRRHDAVRRRHPGSARAHRARRPRDAAAGATRTARHRAGVPRPHRRRRASSRVRCSIAVDCGNGVAGAFAPGALPPPRLRGRRAVLRRRRPLPQPPSRSVATEEPRRPEARASRRATASSGSRSTATAIGSASSRRTATSSTPTGS